MSIFLNAQLGEKLEDGPCMNAVIYSSVSYLILLIKLWFVNT